MGQLAHGADHLPLLDAGPAPEPRGGVAQFAVAHDEAGVLDGDLLDMDTR